MTNSTTRIVQIRKGCVHKKAAYFDATIVEAKYAAGETDRKIERRIRMKPLTCEYSIDTARVELRRGSTGKQGIWIYKYEKPVFLKIGKRAFLCLLGFPQTPNVASAQLRDFCKIASGGQKT